jgi:hypothetical protein
VPEPNVKSIYFRLAWFRLWHSPVTFPTTHVIYRSTSEARFSPAEKRRRTQTGEDQRARKSLRAHSNALFTQLMRNIKAMVGAAIIGTARLAIIAYLSKSYELGLTLWA